MEEFQQLSFMQKTLFCGYQSVLDYYNLHKSEDSKELRISGAAEGGFEISLTEEELNSRPKGDYNTTVRQLRFGGFGNTLTSNFNIGFTREQTLLLFKALESSLGVGQVILI